MLMGVGIAFTLVRWQKKAMPWTKLDREVDDFSIYETTGDDTADWPAGARAVTDDPTFDGTDSGGRLGWSSDGAVPVAPAVAGPSGAARAGCARGRAALH